MDHLLWSLVPWGYQVLLDLEAVRSGPLNVLLSIVTDLGSNLGYLVVLSLVYWCIDKRAGQGLAYSSLISATTQYLAQAHVEHSSPGRSRR